MPLDKYGTIYFLTGEGWVEKPNFKGKEVEVIEEWCVSVFQAPSGQSMLYRHKLARPVRN